MFYATLPSPARVGMEATCDAPWFERVLREHHHELWIGDAAEIRAAMVRKQKTDSRDALHILDLLLTNRFPRIWVPSLAERDLRQMLRHRHKLVRFRTSVMNQLHALAMGQGLCRRKKLWARAGRKELEGLVLDPWASLRRNELLQLLDQLDPWIATLDEAVMQAAESCPAADCLMQQAGVGPVTALGFVLTIGPVSRFANSKKLVSYLGLNPSEDSSAGRQRLGAIILSKAKLALRPRTILASLTRRQGSSSWWQCGESSQCRRRYTRDLEKVHNLGPVLHSED